MSPGLFRRWHGAQFGVARLARSADDSHQMRSPQTLYWLLSPGQESPSGPFDLETLRGRPLPPGSTLCAEGGEVWQDAAEVLGTRQTRAQAASGGDGARQALILLLLAGLGVLAWLLAREMGGAQGLAAFSGGVFSLAVVLGGVVIFVLAVLMPYFVYAAAREARRCRELLEELVEERQR